MPARTKKSPASSGPTTGRDIVMVHSSDLHLGDVATTRAYGGDDTLVLTRVLDAAGAVSADVLLVAGDMFENNRLENDLLKRTARILADAALPVVILPGNHDPATPDSVYRRGGMAAPTNVAILGVTHGKAVTFAEWDLEVWGHAHRDYDDMVPLRSPRARRTRWQVALAHGHYHPKPDRSGKLNPSWLISRDEIAASGVDYLALGHWNQAKRVGRVDVPAYYSGSPEYAESVNVVQLKASGAVSVRRRRLDAKPQP